MPTEQTPMDRSLFIVFTVQVGQSFSKIHIRYHSTTLKILYWCSLDSSDFSCVEKTLVWLHSACSAHIHHCPSWWNLTSLLKLHRNFLNHKWCNENYYSRHLTSLLKLHRNFLNHKWCNENYYSLRELITIFF